MKDYSATITLTVSFKAANEEQAKERPDAISEAASSGITNALGKKTWLSDVEDIETEVEDEN